MRRFLKKSNGQSTLEYAILIIIVIGALLSIQMYIKRGIQGRLKSSTDEIGDQFSPGNTNVIKKETTKSVTLEKFKQGVQSTTMDSSFPEESEETLSMNIINVEQEFWGK